MSDDSAPLDNEPRAKRLPHRLDRPGGSIDDPFHWLRDRDDPDTLAYVEAENRYTEAWFTPLEPLIDELFEEIKSRIQETDVSVPSCKDGWWYVSTTHQGLDYAIHHRGPTRDRATDTTILDENHEAEGHEYFALGSFDVSPDAHLLAWSCDIDGSEHYTLRVRDLRTGVDRADSITDTSPAGTAWSSDSQFVFYLTNDEHERPSTVWRHRLGSPQDQDERVYDEDDQRFHLSIDLCRSGAWIMIEANSKTSSETLLIPADRPESTPRLVLPRLPDIEYHLDHWGDRFVILTNEEAPDFRIMTAPESDPAAWTELVPHRSGQRITRLDCFAGHMVIQDWAAAQPRLRVMTKDGTTATIDVDDAPHDVDIDVNPEWTTDVLRFDTESLISPSSIWEIAITDGGRSTGTRSLLKRTPTPNVDPTRYQTTRSWAPSADGTLVPYDVIRLRDLPGSTPTLVYAYGSYEISVPPWFSVARLSLVDRGWTWVLAHPRGGGELGRQWYFDGRLLNKRNTFEDVNAVAQHLVETGVADAERLAVRGGSAGGLMVGACLNAAPDLWKAAVAEVPFVDVVTTMSDPTLPLTVTEWEEWGDPRVEPFASYMSSYSPYDNLTERAYPAIMATAGLNDPRVSFHEPAKWVARIRSLRTNREPLLLRTEMGAGHGGASGRYDRWRDEARILSFLLTSCRQ